MQKYAKQKRLLSFMLVLSYLLNGCGTAKEVKSASNSDIDEDELNELHELHISKMEKYKESAFIKDFELFNDVYPEFYVNREAKLMMVF